MNWFINSFSAPNEVRELRFLCTDSAMIGDLVKEREAIVKLIKGPFPELRKVELSIFVVWVKEPGKREEDEWRPFIPRLEFSSRLDSVMEMVAQRLEDYVQLQADSTKDLTFS